MQEPAKVEMTDLRNVRAIVFDTFGTVVDWRGSLIADLTAWGNRRGFYVDWASFADNWRDEYGPQKDRVSRGSISWTTVTDLNFEALVRLLPHYGLEMIGQEDKIYLNQVWQRLNPWPDALDGLNRLKTKYIVGPLSNGDIALLVNMAKHADLPWDIIFSCEHFKKYKPDPDTYLGVCRQLRLLPSQVMMCAAHNYDLKAAQDLGLQTAFIPRSTELGPSQTKDLYAEGEWNICAKDIGDLASQMGA